MKKVITYGTFDLFHKGHYNILERAKKAGDYLIVGVTSESYDIERGKLNVRDDLLTRIKNVEATGFADKIILEEYQGQKINDIIKYDVDTLVIGSDWIGKFDYLKEYCEVLYLDRTKDISSTQLRESDATIIRVGIATDDDSDNGFIDEARYVSGLHVMSAFAPNISMARVLEKANTLAYATDDFESFLASVDLVYIKTGIESRALLADIAIAAGKHVIIEPPMSFDVNEAKRLQVKAAEYHVVLIESVVLAYLRAFTQLVWYLHGGLIGDVLAIKSVLNLEDSRIDFLQAQIINLFASRKLLSSQGEPLVKNVFLSTKESSLYFSGIIEQQNAISTFEIAKGIDMKSDMTIYGTKGRLRVPDDWFNIGYFQVDYLEETNARQHYSFNFEGNGFRYLLQELLIMIASGRTESTRYFNEDSLASIRLLNICNMGLTT